MSPASDHFVSVAILGSSRAVHSTSSQHSPLPAADLTYHLNLLSATCIWLAGRRPQAPVIHLHLHRSGWIWFYALRELKHLHLYLPVPVYLHYPWLSLGLVLLSAIRAGSGAGVSAAGQLRYHCAYAFFGKFVYFLSLHSPPTVSLGNPKW